MIETEFEFCSVWFRFYFFCLHCSVFLAPRRRELGLHLLWSSGLHMTLMQWAHALAFPGQLLSVQVLVHLRISLGKFQNILAASAKQAWHFRNTPFPVCSDIHRLTDNLQQTSQGLMHMLVRESGIKQSWTCLTDLATSATLHGSVAPGLRKDFRLMGGWASYHRLGKVRYQIFAQKIPE